MAAVFGLMQLNSFAQYTTTFIVTELDDNNLKGNINSAVSGLLTACNNAQSTGDTLQLSGLNIAPDVVFNIRKLWADCPFRCSETEIVDHTFTMPNGEYQVRNIPLIMMPAEGSKSISWQKYQEAVFNFDKNGLVTDFHLALNADLYIKVMNGAATVDDFMQRQLILEYVERFRNSYNLKDLDFLEQIFSDDALIITGKVITATKSDINHASLNNKKVVYSRQTKREYLSRLERIFKANKHINVLFDDIKVVRHPAHAEYYGVTLKQGYSSDTYSDEGYLFLLWDFTNPDAPQIHVRTWQPDKIDVNTPLPEDEIFSIDDFDI
jgi:hypothetical protein